VEGTLIETADVILRLGGAMLIGAAIGLNRDLHGKPIGMRTLGLVALASAMAVLAVAPDSGSRVDFNPTSRVIQGVLTGIGFLGAGVIVRGHIENRVHGLTSAACTWLTACLGLVCGLAAWPIVAVGVPLIFVLLVFGGPLERISHRWLAGLWGHAEGRRAADEEDESAKRSDSPQ
jgi:putative Mg2+ transporter-C (MgtC) family protein